MFVSRLTLYVVYLAQLILFVISLLTSCCDHNGRPWSIRDKRFLTWNFHRFTAWEWKTDFSRAGAEAWGLRR